MRHGLYAVFLAAFVLVSSDRSAEAETFQSEHYRLRLATVASGLVKPWSLAWLPDGRMLVTERPGRLRIVSSDGTVSPPIQGLPEMFSDGQGGLLDVLVDPDFVDNRTIYFSFAEPETEGAEPETEGAEQGSERAGTAVARAKLDAPVDAPANTTSDGGRLSEVRVLFRQTPKSTGAVHFGSRLVMARDGTLFITIGERGQRELAQDPSVNRGQVIRIHTDGRIPDDNPFVGRPGHRPEIWSYGHRNPQGAALHPDTGALWMHEHGARGGDEINIPLPGRNHGWPVIAYGRHYSGGRIGIGQAAPGMEQPVHYWDPSIAPSGMAFYTGDVFPKWRGDLLVGALKYRLVVRLSLEGERVVGQEPLLAELGERIRDVRQGPDGYIYLLTDSNDGRILRLEPD
ncbi:MAG: PQQ-dependent sugar dehydrogenase [Proteobacteria bacterium]|nr:PQQ-dependent sugar dehydrogenase [Pseudomonadota bacterium]MDA1309618.1 PQQ-dependent sugar dehydrogenase [Pseudomonadota bacterium]